MRVLVFGSSSTKNFTFTPEIRNLDPNFEGLAVDLLTVHGATIGGFGKRNSTLNSKELFIEKYKQTNPDFVCFALGQTDVELGLYYKLVVKGETFDIKEHITYLVNSYVSYVEDICRELGIDKSRVIFKGINLSVLTRFRLKSINYVSRIITENVQEEERSGYLDILRKKYPTSLQRASYTKIFNDTLLERASSVDIDRYFDINDDIEDVVNPGHVRLELIPAFFDHHLIDSLYVRHLCIDKLLKITL